MERTDFMPSGFLENNHECAIQELPVTGVIPEWLSGSLYRNGPGMVSADKPMRHWFDGHAMLHRFSVRSGKVAYQSRFLDCAAYRSTMETGRFTYSDFATDPCRSLFGKLQTIFDPDPRITDSAKVNIGRVGDKTYALGEPLMQVAFDPETLESVGVFDFGKSGRNRMTTAHPQMDGEAAFNLVVQYGPINFYKIYAMHPEVREIASVPVMNPAYLHSFGMSPHYFIIAEFPLVVQSIRLMLRQRPFIENFNWRPENGSRFIIIDRRTGKQKAVIRSDAFFSFHHINAFEEDNRLVIDLDAYEDASIISHYYKERLSDPTMTLPHGRIRRFVLDLETSDIVSSDHLSEACIELPVFNPTYRHNGGYRYVYGCGIEEERPNEFYNRIVKVDLLTGHHSGWSRAGHFPGEPVFVSSPGQAAEDDGVLMSVVLDATVNRSFLLILNARDLSEIARAGLPHAVLFGYHGLFIESAPVR